MKINNFVINGRKLRKIVCESAPNFIRGGPLTTGLDNGPVERGTFDDNFYTNSHLSKISVQN